MTTLGMASKEKVSRKKNDRHTNNYRASGLATIEPSASGMWQRAGGVS